MRKPHIVFVLLAVLACVSAAFAQANLSLSANCGNLVAGDTLMVSVTGPPHAAASFDVGTHTDVPMRETAPGVYSGQYMVQPGDSLVNSPVVAHLHPMKGLPLNIVSMQTVTMNLSGRARGEGCLSTPEPAS